MDDEIRGGHLEDDWIRRLRERLMLIELQSPEWGLPRTLFTETVELWMTVLETGSRYLSTRNPSPVEDADASKTSLVSRMDHAKVEAAVLGLASVATSEEDAATDAAKVALATLRSELLALDSAASGTDGQMPRLFANSSKRVDLDTRAHITVWLARTQLLIELLQTNRILTATKGQALELHADVVRAATESKAAAGELSTLRDQLNDARAERAQGKLADQFKNLHRREGNISWGFRGTAFVLLIASAGVGLKLIGFESPEWQVAVAHLAIVGVFGGASAYAARLAAAHRGTADWAKSIQVQLETFQDFLGAIDDEATRHRVYEDFGRRVLGPPPVTGDEPGTMPTAQLVELLIASARRPQQG